jgi:hypothetical protein
MPAEAGGGHVPAAPMDVEILGLAERLDEITGVGTVNGRALIAELGTDPPVHHGSARRRIGTADAPQPAIRADCQAKPHRHGQPVPAQCPRAGPRDRGHDREQGTERRAASIAAWR